MQFSSRFTLQLISGISKYLKYEDTYFKGTTICAFKNILCAFAITGLTFAAMSLVINLFNKFDLYSDYQYSHLHSNFVLAFYIAIKILKFVHNCLNIQLNCRGSFIKSKLSAVSTCISFKCVKHLVNGLQFLKATDNNIPFFCLKF